MDFWGQRALRRRKEETSMETEGADGCAGGKVKAIAFYSVT